MRDDNIATSAPRVNITACLDAVSMYDAAYHQERDAYDPLARMPPLPIVSAWAYLESVAFKMGPGFWGGCSCSQPCCRAR